MTRQQRQISSGEVSGQQGRILVGAGSKFGIPEKDRGGTFRGVNRGPELQTLRAAWGDLALISKPWPLVAECQLLRIFSPAGFGFQRRACVLQALEILRH